MQRWIRIHDYSAQYLKWVYKVYASQAPAYLCTYWNLDLPRSIYDGTVLEAASYEKIGNRSGLKWRKILFLPVFNIEQINPTFSADEEGFTKKDQVSSFWLPTEYGFQPSPWDFVKFEQHILQTQDDTYPIYQVVNFDKSTNTKNTFWRLNLRPIYYKSTEIDTQLSQVCVFSDYEKKIYDSSTGSFLFNLLEKNQNISLINNFYNKISGLYFLERQS